MRKQLKTYLRLYRASGVQAVFDLWKATRTGAETVLLTVHGEAVTVRPRTPDVSVAINNLGKEFSNLKGLPELKECRLIVDAGGYIGTAARALSRMFPEATVVSVEPSPRNFRLLEQNTADLPNVVRVQAALVADGEDGVIKLMDRGTGHWGYSIAAQDTGAEAIDVAKVSLSSILAQYASGSGRILCKMDIEGAEKDLLDKADSWLARCDVLAIELHERIVPGTEESFANANRHRQVTKLSSDKFLSVKPAVSDG